MMKVAPLSGGFMAVSILGFLIFAILFEKMPTWSLTMMILFAIMFIASIISMTYAPIEDEHLEVLAVHEKTVGARRHRHKNT